MATWYRTAIEGPSKPNIATTGSTIAVTGFMLTLRTAGAGSAVNAGVVRGSQLREERATGDAQRVSDVRPVKL
jgi:hypothetical protein